MNDEGALERRPRPDQLSTYQSSTPNLDRLIDELIALRRSGQLPERSDDALAALANAELAVERDPVRLKLEKEAERRASRRTWAAILLARDLDTCESILERRAVMARKLDAEILRRALRGGQLPPVDGYIEITNEMLDAVAETGALLDDTVKKGKRR
jgi:hypothetical protein